MICKGAVRERGKVVGCSRASISVSKHELEKALLPFGVSQLRRTETVMLTML